jgi:hypothetical protein
MILDPDTAFASVGVRVNLHKSFMCVLRGGGYELMIALNTKVRS